MRYVKWIFVVLLVSSLTSFVSKDKPTGGLNVGDIAPDFTIQTMSEVQPSNGLSDLKGKYVLLSFWASYDAQSRMQNASLSNALRQSALHKYQLGSSANVSIVKRALVKKELIEIEKRQVVIPDPIMAVWLKRELRMFA